MPKKDEVIITAIKDVVGTTKLGRRKVIVKVQRKQPQLSGSKIRRVYEQAGFTLYKRMKNRRVDNPANPIEVPLAPNIEWAMDFMSDSLANGRRIRTLNIIDQYNRKCLQIAIGFSMPSKKVIEIVQRAIDEHGKPEGIRTDNGSEFTSGIFQDWMHDEEINWVKIQKGKPQQNAIIERFNRTYREDILDANVFFSLEHANQVTEPWINDYNTERPHQSLNFCTPDEYVA